MSDRFEDFKTEKREITMLVAPQVPAQIDVENIAEEAIQAGFAKIHELLAERGFKCSGDMMPDEARALDKLFQMFVRSVLVNRLDPRIDRGFRLVGVEACEPYELSVAEGVEVEITGTMGPSSHCPTVTITATSRDLLVSYLIDNWGDNDDTGGWLSDVVNRIEEFGVDPDRLAVATAAYEKVFEGPWGLKASEEDALLGVIGALYPDDFPKHANGIYGIRGDERLAALADWVGLEGPELGGAREICAALLPRLDAVMKVTAPVTFDEGAECENAAAELGEGKRTILIHLNVEVPADDMRSADEIITLVEGALDVGLGDGTDLDGILVDTALAEEV